MKNKKRKKTPKYVEVQYWSTMMMVDDELVDRINVWEFYYFAAATIVPLLEDFMDVAEFMAYDKPRLVGCSLPEEYVTPDDFGNMISAISLLVRYNNEGGLVYEGRDIDFERGDSIAELTNALHQFANLLPYLNDRHFTMSEERYDDAPAGKHCSFDELCNLDKTIARRIFNTLQVFAAYSLFPPPNFERRFYSCPVPDTSLTKDCVLRDEWNKAIEAMVESWRWILERKPVVTDNGCENVPEEIYYGLHLFAEYLPEMQND